MIPEHPVCFILWTLWSVSQQRLSLRCHLYRAKKNQSRWNSISASWVQSLTLLPSSQPFHARTSCLRLVILPKRGLEMIGKSWGWEGTPGSSSAPHSPSRVCSGNPGVPGPSLMGSRCAYIWEGHPRKLTLPPTAPTPDGSLLQLPGPWAQKLQTLLSSLKVGNTGEKKDGKQWGWGGWANKMRPLFRTPQRILFPF